MKVRNDAPCFRTYDSHGNTTKPSSSGDHSFSPVVKRLDPGTLIKEPTDPVPINSCTGNHITRVVRSFGRHEINISIDRVGHGPYREAGSLVLGNIRQPLEYLDNTTDVVFHRVVGDSVIVHDLSTAQLRVTGVHLIVWELD